MSRGIYVDKSAAAEKIDRYVKYRRLGFKIVAHDEEGMVPWNLDEYQRGRQFSNRTLAPLEYFFAWGPRQAEFLAKQAPDHAKKILSLGHPRGDMTRKELRGFYDDDARRLQQRYGRFILINSNFALCNHFHGEHGLIRIKRIQDPALRDFYLHVEEHQQKLFDYFVELIRKLRQEFPDNTVVVRPHPSENHEYWRSLFAEDKRVCVVHEGNVYPWLIAAETMIHNSCTTGVEAYLLTQPALAYRPIRDASVENELPNILSDQQYTCDDVIEKVREILSSPTKELPEDDPQKQEALAYYMSAINGRFSSERMIDAIDQIRLAPLAPEMLLQRGYAFFQELKKRLRRKLAPRPSLDKAQEYRSQKFPGISLEEVEESLQKFRILTGRFALVHASQIEKDLFRIVRRS